MVTDGVTDGLTVINTVLDEAVVGLAHAALDVTTHCTASLLATDEEV